MRKHPLLLTHPPSPWQPSRPRHMRLNSAPATCENYKRYVSKHSSASSNSRRKDRLQRLLWLSVVRLTPSTRKNSMLPRTFSTMEERAICSTLCISCPSLHTKSSSKPCPSAVFLPTATTGSCVLPSRRPCPRKPALLFCALQNLLPLLPLIMIMIRKTLMIAPMWPAVRMRMIGTLTLTMMQTLLIIMATTRGLTLFADACLRCRVGLGA